VSLKSHEAMETEETKNQGRVQLIMSKDGRELEL
jgi:hypothetical protein